MFSSMTSGWPPFPMKVLDGDVFLQTQKYWHLDFHCTYLEKIDKCFTKTGF